MESIKDRFTCLGRNSGSLVVDPDADLVADMRSGNLDQSARRRKADRIVDDRIDCPREAVRLTHHHRRVLARSGEGNSRVARLATGFPAGDDLLDEWPEIDSFEGSPGEFGVGPGRLADVVD